jgi:hypothetical protein
VVPRGGDQLVEHGGVDRCGVCDHLGGRHLQHLERPPEQQPSCVRVAASRDENVNDLPVLVDRSIHVPPHSVDLDVCFVDVPSIAWPVAGEPGGVGQQRGESLHPQVHGDVVDLDFAFDQQFLHIAVGQVEP